MAALWKTGVLTLLAGALLHGQSGGVSILPAKAGAQQGSLFGRDRVRVQGATLESLLSFALETEPWQISGPDWIRSARYDVVAAPGQTGGAAANAREAVLEALVQGFSITYYRESRLSPTWTVRLPGNPPGRLKGPDSDRFPGLSISTGPTYVRLICNTCELSQALGALKTLLRTEVTDETGVNGVFEFSVMWKKDDATDMIRAWREETGLELAQEFTPAEMVVIYNIARPDAPSAERPAYACETSPEARAALASLPRMDDYGLSFERRFGPRHELARRHPDDIVLQLRAQDALRRLPNMSSEWDRALLWYRELARPHLRDLLEARLILPLQRERSRQLLLGVPRQAPEYPWARLALAEWASLHAPNDVSQLEVHVSEFRELCPRSLDVLAYAQAISSADLRLSLRKGLEAEFSRRVDADAIRAIRHYWDLLLRDEPRTGRQRIQMDVQRLRFLNRIDDREWVDTMLHGYALLQDQAAERVLAALAARGRHTESDRVRTVLDRWHGLGANANVATAEDYLEVIDQHPDLDIAPIPAALQVAAVYASDSGRKDQAAALVERGLLAAARREEHRRLSDVPAESKAAEARVAEAYDYARTVVQRLQ